MSDPGCKAVYFLQKPFTADTEQMGCYYFHILQAVEQCKRWGTAIVPPRFPLCPRDNTKVEFNSTDHWSSSILAIGSVDSKEVLDYSHLQTLTLKQFYKQSHGKVRTNIANLDISGFQFTSDNNSDYMILNMPPRWDLQGDDAHVFYNILYDFIPLKSDIIDGKIPDWYKYLSKSHFLGVHWRRGDRGNSILGQIGRRLWFSTDPDKVAACINKYIERNPEIQWVYVSTNSGSIIDRALLKQLVKLPVHFFDAPSNITPLEIWKWDLTDLILCAKAKHLMLSPGGLEHSSAFGRIMYAECLRQTPEDALVSFMPMI